MSVSCTFCRIVEGAQEASIVYQDELVVAFLDVMPINPGHTLVIPRRHSAFLSEVGEDEAARMFLVGRKLDRAVRASKLRCDAVNLFLNDGAEAGQRVFHTHLHVVPRILGDSLHRDLSAEMPTREDLEAAASDLRQWL